MLSSALVGGVLLALIEAAGIAVSHYTADNYRQISVVERMQLYNERQRQQQQQQQKIASFYTEPNEASLRLTVYCIQCDSLYPCRGYFNFYLEICNVLTNN